MNIASESFITILGWMVSELELRGNELLCYAIIYGFSQDGESQMCQPRRYICNWLGCTPPTVDRVLKSLIEKGLIEKTTENFNGITINSYRISDIWGYKNSLGGIKKENFPPHPLYKEKGDNNIQEDNINPIIRKENTKRKESGIEKVYEDLSFVREDMYVPFTTWLEYKLREHKERYKTKQTLVACYNNLLQKSGDDPDVAMAIVNQSMANRWKGLFNLKTEKNENFGTSDKGHPTDQQLVLGVIDYFNNQSQGDNGEDGKPPF